MQRRRQRLRPRLRQILCNRLRQLIGCTVTESRRVSVRGFLLLIAGSLHLCISMPVLASPGNGDVAEFIVNFVRYTAWSPDSTRRAINICYAHGGALAASAMVMGQPVMIKGYPVAWRPVGLPAQLPGCDVVWLNADVRPAPREWLNAVTDKPVLTISNYADFTADGGIVGAYRVGNDWHFEVNLEALQRARINIAAAALRLSQKPKPMAVGETR